METKIFNYLQPTSLTTNFDSAKKLIHNWELTGFLERNIIPNCYDQHDHQHLTIALHSLYPDEAKTELTALFRSLLMSTAAYRTNGQMFISQYWDQYDEISADIMQNIINNYNSDISFEDNVFNYGFEHDWFSDDLYFNKHWSNFVDKYPMYNNDEFEQILLEWFDTNIHIDYEIPQLIRQSAPNDLTLYFGTNWDDDYNTMVKWAPYESKRLAEIDINQYIDDIKNTPLAWLIQTQGYKLIDVFDKEKWKNSPFLQAVHSELYDYASKLTGLQLVAIPNSTNWDAITNLLFHKTGIIKAGTTFGLFDRVNGSSAGFCIKIEKDIHLNNDEHLYSVTLNRTDQPYNYSPDAVCGLVKSSNEQLYILEVANDSK